MRIKSGTYQVAIVISVELWGVKKSHACLLLIAKRYSGKGGSSVWFHFAYFYSFLHLHATLTFLLEISSFLRWHVPYVFLLFCTLRYCSDAAILPLKAFSRQTQACPRAAYIFFKVHHANKGNMQ